MNRRAEILQALVRFEAAPEPLLRELRQFGWDWSGEPLVILGRDDLLSILDRFLGGQISAAQLQAWAESLECREDVAFDPADEPLLDDVFFRLATPFINEPLTREVVQSMKDALASIHRA